MRTRDDRGQVTVLVIGFAIVLLMAIGLVVDSSAAYLSRQSLATLADGAALAGADQLQGDTAYDEGLGEHTPIDRETARRSVEQHLRAVGAYDDHPGLRVRVDVVGDRVVVRLVSPLELPFRVDGLTDTEVAASGAARVTVDP